MADVVRTLINDARKMNGVARMMGEVDGMEWEVLFSTRECSKKCVNTFWYSCLLWRPEAGRASSCTGYFQSTPVGKRSGNSLRNTLAISDQSFTLRFQLRWLCMSVKYSCFSSACSVTNAPLVFVVLRRHL